MNYLILEPSEKIEENIYQIKNLLKVNHINEILKKNKNDKLKAIKIDHSYGIFTILEKTKTFILGRYRQILKPKLKSELSLLCAVQRPQTTKKILQIAGMFGIREIYFFYAKNSRTQYLTSSIWENDQIKQNLVEGMQQGGNIFLPKTFYNINIDLYLNQFRNYHKILLYKQSKFKFDIKFKKVDKVVLLLGPEAGFTFKEISKFKNYNFKSFKLSSKILRSEQALLYSLSKLESFNFPF